MVAVIFLFLLFMSFKGFEGKLLVETFYGSIQGFSHIGEKTGFQAEVFLGIPYAQGPFGNLRFEKPKPPRPWNHTILQATNYGFACLSIENPYNKYTNYSEDCLTLNIIRPASESSDPSGYPIIIWIFGETFESGTSSNFDYQQIIDNLVSHGIIFISFNYRLGPFGFFSSGNELAKGNFGLWDQLEALKFVNKIGLGFGGNLNKVTLFGESAGAASISWLTLNSEASKYFSQAFTMSGSVASAWAHSNITIRFSRSFIALLGCDENLDVMSCMKKQSIQDIQFAAKTVSKLAESEHYYSILFHPWFDNDFVKAKTLDEAIQSAPKINIVMSLNSQEAIPFVFHSSSPLYLSQQEITNYGSSNFTESVKKLLDGEHCFGENQEKVEEKIIDFYQAQSLQYSHNPFLQTYVQLLSDIQFNVPFIRDALKRAENGQKVFVFRNSFVSDQNRNFIVDGVGVGHGMELDKFFGYPPKKGSNEEIVQKRFIDILMNFVKLGQPFTSTYYLQPSNPKSIPFLDINVTPNSYENLWPERLQFWNSLIPEFGYDWPSGTCNNILLP